MAFVCHEAWIERFRWVDVITEQLLCRCWKLIRYFISVQAMVSLRYRLY